MQPRIAAALMLVLATGPAPLMAQGEIRLGVGGGLTVPVRDYTDAVEKGWAGQASLTFFPAGTASLGFRLDGFYGRSDLSSVSGHRSLLGSTANLVFQFGARRSPNRFYLFAGGGYVRTVTSGPGLGELKATDPALSAGGGVSFGGRGFALFAEARYLTVYSDGTKPQLLPLVAGVSFGGF